MLGVLVIGSVHHLVTSPSRNGLTRQYSALCIIIGASLCPLVVVRRYASSSGQPLHCWVVTWPVLIVIGGPIRRRRVAVRALERRRALHVFIGSHCCWVVLLFVVGSSFPHADVIRVTMVRVGRVLFDTLVLGEMPALSICGQRHRFSDVLSGPPIAWPPLVFISP